MALQTNLKLKTNFYILQLKTLLRIQYNSSYMVLANNVLFVHLLGVCTTYLKIIALSAKISKLLGTKTRYINLNCEML